MYYFIPSWYDSNRPWYDSTLPWQFINRTMQFDETINQIRMFHQANEPTKVLVLNYSPNLGYFMHRQDLLGIDYWSLFDELQGFNEINVMPVNYLDFAWPDTCSFYYNPFYIEVMKENKKYANILFGEDGHLLKIKFYQSDLSHYDYIFDDRGYLSSILHYDVTGVEDFQEYLNAEGNWVLRESLKNETQRIIINPMLKERVNKLSYASMTEFVQDFLQSYCSNELKATDVLIIAASDQNNQLLSHISTSSQRVYSFFGDRYDLVNAEKVKAEIKHASLLVTMNQEQKALLQDSLSDSSIPILTITPFDTRLRLGRSQQKIELRIYWHIDQMMSMDEIEDVLSRLVLLMKENEMIEVVIGMYAQSRQRHQQLQSKVEYYNHELISKIKENDNEFVEIITGETNTESMKERIQLQEIRHENLLLQTLQSARLLVDLSQQPDLFTQIAGISIGIPQINRVASEYVSHQKNGYIINAISELREAVIYFIEGLYNWNQSLVYSVNLITDYLSGQLVEEWKHNLKGGSDE